VHNTIALNAPDQLRQRIAWAMSQMFVLSVDDNVINQGLGADFSEPFLAFYDIFVRHAFGNLREVLREISYSPPMSMFLTFLDSESFAFENKRQHPDENFARELMQVRSSTVLRLSFHVVPAHLLATTTVIPCHSFICYDDRLSFCAIYLPIRLQHC